MLHFDCFRETDHREKGNVHNSYSLNQIPQTISKSECLLQASDEIQYKQKNTDKLDHALHKARGQETEGKQQKI